MCVRCQHAFALFVFLTLEACSGTSGIEAGLPLQSSAHGQIQVVIEIGDITESPDNTRILGHLHFLRYWDVDTETADILAGGERQLQLEVGHCVLHTPDQHLDDALASTPTQARVEHLDAGDVLVHAGDIVAGSIAPRHLPALFPYVTGVQYEELLLTDGLKLGLPEGAEVSITAFGGDDVGPFNVIATALAFPGRVTAMDNEDLDVNWAAEEGPGEREYVVISIGSGYDDVELRCLAEDSGKFRVPRAALDQVSGVGSVSVARVRRVPFVATGIMWGELEVVVRHVVTAASP